MIAFDLQCAAGHTFEGWFDDGKAFEKQLKQSLITCPVCENPDVYKIPSTFAIKSSKPVTKAPPSSAPETNIEALTQELVDYVDKNFDNVGADFTTEALKIHYGVSEPRNIRGVSTTEEENTLKKEGVQFLKFPLPVTSETDS